MRRFVFIFCLLLLVLLVCLLLLVFLSVIENKQELNIFDGDDDQQNTTKKYSVAKNDGIRVPRRCTVVNWHKYPKSLIFQFKKVAFFFQNTKQFSDLNKNEFFFSLGCFFFSPKTVVVRLPEVEYCIVLCKKSQF